MNAPICRKKRNCARLARPWASVAPNRIERKRLARNVTPLSMRSVPGAPLLLQLRDHVQAEDVRLPLFERPRLFLERRADGPLAVDRVLDAQAVGDLVKHHVFEEGVELDVGALVRSDQAVGDWNEDLVELGAHGVFQLQAARPLLELHLLVVRQVDRDGLRPGVAVPGVVDRVVGVQIGIRSRRLAFVLGRDRQPALQLGKERCELR